MANQVIVLVGTTKGAFFFHSDERRREWRMTGPHLGGWEVYSLLGDSRHTPRVYAGTGHFVYGTTVRVSDDFGANWTEVESSPRYEQDSGFTLKHIWQLVPGHHSEPDTLYAGVEEAGLFVSRNRGRTWEEVSGLTQHPTRPGWAPGGGGLCLHTILIDPNNPRRMWVAMSAVGVFRTDDGGESWEVAGSGLPDHPVYSGVLRDSMAVDALEPAGIYFGTSMGELFYSPDAGERWEQLPAQLPRITTVKTWVLEA